MRDPRVGVGYRKSRARNQPPLIATRKITTKPAQQMVWKVSFGQGVKKGCVRNRVKGLSKVKEDCTDRFF